MSKIEFRLQFYGGEEIKELRRKLLMNQYDFWHKLGVSQSGGSRYESGRDIPDPVLLLVNLVYGRQRTRERVLRRLIGEQEAID